MFKAPSLPVVPSPGVWLAELTSISTILDCSTALIWSVHSLSGWGVIRILAEPWGFVIRFNSCP